MNGEKNEQAENCFHLSFIIEHVGCASNSNQYAVNIDSSPQGASLICNGSNWGYTPRKLYYDEGVKNQATLNVSDCSANWVSGAKANYPRNLIVFPEGGMIFTLKRPDVSGFSQDAEFELKVKNMQAQRRQVNAAQQQQYEIKTTDWVCMNNCTASGALWGFCNSKCSY